MDRSCPFCDNESSVVQIQRTEDLNIRGEIISVDVKYFHCEACGEEFELPGQGDDPLQVAYDEYRRRKGFVFPKEIRKFRKKYGLTQKELSELFGIGIATINRYEKGALQDEAHDQLLRLGMDKNNLLHLIEKKPTSINQQSKETIVKIIKQEEQDGKYLLGYILEKCGEYPADLFSGYMKFNIDKFFETIRWFCFKSQTYKTKLMKLLFFADFKHFKEYGVSITGARYAHLPYGPVPDQFELWFMALLNSQPTFIKEEVWCNDSPAEIFYSETSPDFSEFSTSELKTLAAVKETFENFTARKISDFSHREKGYQETKNGELISYQFAESLQI